MLRRRIRIHPSRSLNTHGRLCGLHHWLAGSPTRPAESRSSSYGPMVHLRLLSTPPRGDAVTVSYGPERLPGGDSHPSDRVHSQTGVPSVSRRALLLHPAGARRRRARCPPPADAWVLSLRAVVSPARSLLLSGGRPSRPPHGQAAAGPCHPNRLSAPFSALSAPSAADVFFLPAFCFVFSAASRPAHWLAAASCLPVCHLNRLSPSLFSPRSPRPRDWQITPAPVRYPAL